LGGVFGVASKEDCVFDLFFGIDYHSHLGTKKGGIAVYGPGGFDRAIHNIENSPFRTKFEKEFEEMEGRLGIGCISDNEPQPLMVRSHLGNFAITTVGRINNQEELVRLAFENGASHFLEMSGGDINPTELVASLINQKDCLVEGIKYAQEKIEGSMTMLILTQKEIYAARDFFGRTPLIVGQKNGACCVSFESFAFINLGYKTLKELGAGEIAVITPEGCETVSPAREEMRICSFLWAYYGYPTSVYEGVSVEKMRYNCGMLLALKDKGTEADIVAGVPDSGTAHAIGYANASGVPFARPCIKYTPTWPRSFMSGKQKHRKLVAKMKLLPVDPLIKDKRLMLIEDSIVRGTQLRETTDFLYESGAKEIHIRTSCPPPLFRCKYLNFSRFTSEDDLIARKVIKELERGEPSEEVLLEYADPNSEKYSAMIEAIRVRLNFTSLGYLRLDDLVKAIGIDPRNLCTYCWSGCAGVRD